MNIDSEVVFGYISPLRDRPIVCDWATIVFNISRKNVGEPPPPPHWDEKEDKDKIDEKGEGRQCVEEENRDIENQRSKGGEKGG